MKKAALCSALLLVTTVFCSCGSDSTAKKFDSSSTLFSEADNDTSKESKSSDPDSSSTTVEKQAPSVEYDENDVVDLTAMSPTMVYSEVFAMMNEPDEYKGKAVVAKGPFAHYDDPDTGMTYYAVIVKDATACCAQGIEFVLAGDKKYPDDYPKDGDEITVKGGFNTYTDETGNYVQLVDAKII